MADLAVELDALARERDLWGVARVDRGTTTELDVAYGLADARHGIATTTATRFAIASGGKTFTALAVLQLVEAGELALSTPARRLLGADLPLVEPDVTIEHLLSHTSGIGDYLDESLDLDTDAYLMPVGVQHLATTEAFVPLLDGHPTKFAAGTDFAYCNGGYVVLALVAERVSGMPYHDLVEQRVLAPAGMAATAFLRSDELPGDAAVGYLDVDGALRSNVFHLPVRGNGDGGIYSTTGDLARFWPALLGGVIVGADTVAAMLRPRGADPDPPHCRYGLGVWRHPTSEIVFMEGADTGVSFRSLHDPERGLTHTVISNTSDGAWAVSRLLAAHLGTSFA
jgi:CubicO group peptidase (beta-lactamase class C family)